jgi:hypothetical protein
MLRIYIIISYWCFFIDPVWTSGLGGECTLQWNGGTIDTLWWVSSCLTGVSPTLDITLHLPLRQYSRSSNWKGWGIHVKCRPSNKFCIFVSYLLYFTVQECGYITAWSWFGGKVTVCHKFTQILTCSPCQPMFHPLYSN